MPEFTAREAAWSDCARPALLHGWNALAQLAGEPNPFFESWYLLPSLRGFDAQARTRMLLVESDGDLAGLMPLARERRYAGKPLPHLANWIHPNIFLGAPLVARGLERDFWRALLAWADANCGKALFLHLTGMPLSGPLHAALAAVLEEEGRHSAVVFREERAMLVSGETPEAYFQASLSSKKRKELRRQHNRLSELGEVSFSREQGADGLDAWMDRFLALELASWKGQGGSAMASAPATLELFREALASAAQQGRLERLALNLDGEPIAMLASFITPPGSYSYKTTFDESYSRFSPGVLLQCENLQVLARGDVQWTDSCATADHPMIDHIWRERRPVGRISIAIGGRLRRAAFRQLLKAELGRNPKGIEA